jgi:nitrate/nitrite-specific signal transduction histidine kinase
MLIVIVAILATTLIPLYNGFQNTDNLAAQHYSAKFFVVISEKLIVAFILIFVASFIITVLITHRFCGPLVNFNKTFQKIAHGNLDCKVILRRNDFLKSEAENVNEMIDVLSFSFNDLKKYNRLLTKRIEILMNSNHKIDKMEISLSEIKQLAENCERTLNHINTSESLDFSEIKN